MAFIRGYTGSLHTQLKHISLTNRHLYQPVFWNFIRLSAYSSYLDDSQIDVKPSSTATNKITIPVTNQQRENAPTTASRRKISKYIIKETAKTVGEWEYEINAITRPKTHKEHPWKRSVHNKKNRIIEDESEIHIPEILGEVLFGKFPIYVALQARKRTFHKLYMKSSLLEKHGSDPEHIVYKIRTLAKELSIPIASVSLKFLDLLSYDPLQGQRQHQGICGDVSPLKLISWDTDNIRSVLADMTGPPQVWLMLQSIQDPNTIGVVMRTAHYVGVNRILAHNCCKLTPAVSKQSAGAIEIPDIYSIDDLSDFLQVCRSDDWQILGTTGSSGDGVVSVDKVSVDRNTIILLGDEGYKETEEICSLCDSMLIIPQSNRPNKNTNLLDYLNISVSAGITLHHLMSSVSTS